MYGGVSDDIWLECRVISILEVTKADIAPTFLRLQGLTRSHWLQMEDNTYRVSSLLGQNLPKTFGMELYDEQGTPVGYLGIEKTQEYALIAQDIQRLRETAETVLAAIVKPLEQGKESL